MRRPCRPSSGRRPCTGRESRTQGNLMLRQLLAGLSVALVPSIVAFGQTPLQPSAPDDLQTHTIIVTGCLTGDAAGHYEMTGAEPVAGEQYAMKGTTTNPNSNTVVLDPSGALMPPAFNSSAIPSGAAATATAGQAAPSNPPSGVASSSAAPGTGAAVQRTGASVSAALSQTSTSPPPAVSPTGTAGGSASSNAAPGSVGTSGVLPPPATDATGSSGTAAMSPMAPTSSVPTAVAGAVGTVSGVGAGTAPVSVPSFSLASNYQVTSESDLKGYRGRRLQVVGVVLSPSVARAAGATATQTDGPQMRIESVRVLGRCK